MVREGGIRGGKHGINNAGRSIALQRHTTVHKARHCTTDGTPAWTQGGDTPPPAEDPAGVASDGEGDPNPTLTATPTPTPTPDGVVWDGEVGAGELIFIPELWGHQV